MNAIDICNLSLGMLGIPTITSFNDENENAGICRAFYQVCVDRVLRDHAWSFATCYQSLEQLSNVVTCEEKYPIACAKPVDIIRIIGLVSKNAYKVVGESILVAELPETLIYVKRISDASKFDVSFCEALQYLLASELVMSNTKDANLASYYRQQYEQRLAVARSIDSAENVHSFQLPKKRSKWLGW